MSSALLSLPTPSTRRLAVRVTNDAIRQIRGGHPWVFDQSITSLSHEGEPGDLAVIFGGERNFVAIGLYDPRSPIRIKVLHQGKPITIDTAFWQTRIDQTIERRKSLADNPGTTAYRVIHGENDQLPGLVLDRYADTYVLKVYSAAWIVHLPALVEIIESRLHPESLVLRFSRDLNGKALHGLGEGDALIGTCPSEPVMFLEHGLTFQADVVHGQKTGHFLDQRENRKRVRAMAHGARVLDVFACTGGFSVSAAAGGARLVQSVDLSAPALETAVINMGYNAAIPNVKACEHITTVGDAFETMQGLIKQRKRFNIVIVDPPSFARRQLDHDRALRSYEKLTRLALDLIEDGGTLVQSSCSSRVSADEFYGSIHGAAADSRYRVSEIARTAHAIDHPIEFPEGAYLKTLFARVDHRR
jgi:23S rRNA (cytosine1962-C5)-methyltransferase